MGYIFARFRSRTHIHIHVVAVRDQVCVCERPDKSVCMFPFCATENTITNKLNVHIKCVRMYVRAGMRSYLDFLRTNWARARACVCMCVLYILRISSLQVLFSKLVGWLVGWLVDVFYSQCFCISFQNDVGWIFFLFDLTYSTKLKCGTEKEEEKIHSAPRYIPFCYAQIVCHKFPWHTFQLWCNCTTKTHFTWNKSDRQSAGEWRAARRWKRESNAQKIENNQINKKCKSW